MGLLISIPRPNALTIVHDCISLLGFKLKALISLLFSSRLEKEKTPFREEQFRKQVFT